MTVEATLTVTTVYGATTVTLDDDDRKHLLELVGTFGWGAALGKALSYAAANIDDLTDDDD